MEQDKSFSSIDKQDSADDTYSSVDKQESSGSHPLENSLRNGDSNLDAAVKKNQLPILNSSNFSDINVAAHCISSERPSSLTIDNEQSSHAGRPITDEEKQVINETSSLQYLDKQKLIADLCYSSTRTPEEMETWIKNLPFAGSSPAAISGVSSKIYFTISEIESMVEIKQDKLLHYGCMGRLRFVTIIPSSSMLSDQEGFSPANDMHQRFPFFCVVEKNDCMQIQVYGQAYVKGFDSGFTLSGSNRLEFLPGSSIKKLKNHMWLVKPDDILIKKDNLLVLSIDLLEFLENENIFYHKDLKQDSVEKTKRLNLNEEPAYPSDDLQYLIQTAKHFWKDIDLEKKETFLSHDDIVTYLKEKKGFSHKLADAGATIITPLIGRKGGRKRKAQE